MKSILTFALLLPVSAFACLNVDGTTQDGGSRREWFVTQRLKQAISTDPAKESARDRFRLRRDATDAQAQELRAVDDILHGKFKAGAATLHELERLSPGKYSIASNLGTAYELMGDNANALKWIEEGMRRNPDAHMGTEWIHVLILKAKIDGGEHPERTTLPHIFHIPANVHASTEFTVDGERYTATDIKAALYYQLQERLIFVKPKDTYVADLLYSLALLEAKLGTLEQAIGVLRLARDYGFPDEALLTRLELNYRSIINTTRFKKWAFWTAISISVLSLLGAYAWKKRHEKWFFWTRGQYKAYMAAKALQQAQGGIVPEAY